MIVELSATDKRRLFRLVRDQQAANKRWAYNASFAPSWDWREKRLMELAVDTAQLSRIAELLKPRPRKVSA